jgi:class III poly(R)-hydroxyalkanoic acid synthase PhaE subunit
MQSAEASMVDDPRPRWQGSAAGSEPLSLAAARFQEAAQRFAAELSRASAATAGEAATRFADALREQFAAAPAPWGGVAAAAAGMGAGDVAGARQWLAMGPTREHQLRWQRMAQAWQRIEAAQLRLQRLWSDALREAALAFSAALQTTPPQSAQSTPQAWYDQWVDCAEAAYARMAHGEEFCATQAECVNASSQWLAELRASVEQYSKLLDLPTRSELNTLTLRLKALEQRLRQPEPPAAVAPEPPPSPSAPRERPAARGARAARARRQKGRP